ncbi:MAG: substrate-binding domain-containing protein [Spirochaetes bacterium]|nr:substrate-binding domain-containing protein [Spirochaetota bacterium]
MTPRPAPLMKYGDVAAVLRRELSRGLHRPRLPGERAVAQRFKINFKTANKAIGVLVDEGLVEYVRGKGAVPRKAAPARGPLVGLVLRTTGHIFEPMTRVMIGALQKGGLLPIVQDTQDSGFQDNPAAHLARVLAHGAQTLILEGEHLLVNRPKVRKLLSGVERLAFIRLYETDFDFRALRVLSDYRQGAFLATAHLASLGHQRIAFVTHAWVHGKAGYGATLHRATLEGYRAALDAAGLSPIVVEETGDEGQRHMAWRALLSGRSRPTAIFALGDWRLVRAWPLIRAAGLSVPRDLALVGYENTPWSTGFEVPFTSVSIQEEEMARLLVEGVLGGDGSAGRIDVAPRLIVRASCGGAGVQR